MSGGDVDKVETTPRAATTYDLVNAEPVMTTRTLVDQQTLVIQADCDLQRDPRKVVVRGFAQAIWTELGLFIPAQLSRLGETIQQWKELSVGKANLVLPSWGKNGCLSQAVNRGSGDLVGTSSGEFAQHVERSRTLGSMRIVPDPDSGEASVDQVGQQGVGLVAVCQSKADQVGRERLIWVQRASTQQRAQGSVGQHSLGYLAVNTPAAD